MTDVREIPLSNGGVALVDAEDYEWLSRWKWKRHVGGYACRTGWDKVERKWLCILMHRFIVLPPEDIEVDHKNRNRLDNRRCNLRPATRQMNVDNSEREYAQIYPDEKVCEMCGRTYICNPRKRKRQKTCSPACATALRNRNMSITKRTRNMTIPERLRDQQ